MAAPANQDDDVQHTNASISKYPDCEVLDINGNTPQEILDDMQRRIIESYDLSESLTLEEMEEMKQFEQAFVDVSIERQLCDLLHNNGMKYDIPAAIEIIRNNDIDYTKYKYLMFALLLPYPDNDELVSLLLPKYTAKQITDQRTIALLCAIEARNIELTRKLMADGDINYEYIGDKVVDHYCTYGTTLVHAACRMCHIPTDKRDDPDALIIQDAWVDIIIKLIENGAPTNVNDYHSTPLIQAVLYNVPRLVAVLIETDCFPGWAYDYTAIEFACIRNYTDVILILLNSGKVRPYSWMMKWDDSDDLDWPYDYAVWHGNQVVIDAIVAKYGPPLTKEAAHTKATGDYYEQFPEEREAAAAATVSESQSEPHSESTELQQVDEPESGPEREPISEISKRQRVEPDDGTN